MVICRDKSKLDLKKALLKLKKSVSHDIYTTTREWPYSNMRKTVFAEEYMQDGNNEELCDYKFYCFNGIAQYCQLISNRNSNESIAFYNREWKRQEFCGLNPEAKPDTREHSKPAAYGEMLRIADTLSGIAPFLRVDLYYINGRVYFGEMTFYPNSGVGRFEPAIWDERLGECLKLPKAKTNK